LLQCVELDCGRTEARAIEAFDVCSEQVCFPYAARAAMLMQRTAPCKDPTDDGVVFLLTSRAWIARQGDPRRATLNGFLGAMARHGSETAFRLALSKKPSWLP
jgi:hypothetical protein